MDDALLKLKEPKIRKRDKFSSGRKTTLEEAVGYGSALSGLGLAGAAAKMGAFKPKQSSVKKKKDKDEDKDKDLNEKEGSFKKGGLVRQGKPKLAKKGWR